MAELVDNARDAGSKTLEIYTGQHSAAAVRAISEAYFSTHCKIYEV